jgi:hypothetical protein
MVVALRHQRKIGDGWSRLSKPLRTRSSMTEHSHPAGTSSGTLGEVGSRSEDAREAMARADRQEGQLAIKMTLPPALSSAQPRGSIRSSPHGVEPVVGASGLVMVLLWCVNRCNGILLRGKVLPRQGSPENGEFLRGRGRRGEKGVKRYFGREMSGQLASPVWRRIGCLDGDRLRTRVGSRRCATSPTTSERCSLP